MDIPVVVGFGRDHDGHHDAGRAGGRPVWFLSEDEVSEPA